MRVKVNYIWKVLTVDGLLKEPAKFGPYYEQESVNGYSGGYESKDEAIAMWMKIKEAYGFGVSGNLVLIEEYTLVSED